MNIKVNYDKFNWATFKSWCTYVDSDAKKSHFPDDGEKEAEITVKEIKLDKWMDYDEIVKFCEIGENYRFLTPAEFQAYVEKYPPGDKWYCSFGQVWQYGVSRMVSWLSARESYRAVSVDNCSRRWHGFCRVRVVCKSLDTSSLGSSGSLIFGHLETIKKEIAEIEKLLEDKV